jgi:diaminopimelate decarboxylase
MDNPNAVVKPRGRAAKSQAQLLEKKELDEFVLSFLQRREEFLAARREHGSPLYLIESSVVRKRVAKFQATFRAAIPDFRVYYAVKSNSHPDLCKMMVKSGIGLDVSSGQELESAISSGASDIVFSGPGKTDAELNLAAKYREKVTVLIDSFNELDRLEAAAARSGRVVRAGVRLTTDERGLWRKFGIPLAELSRFLRESSNHRHVSLKGLQFHTSWNLTPGAQVTFLEKIGAVLTTLEPQLREKVTFIDIGGGFWPPAGEWLQRPPGVTAAPHLLTEEGFDPLLHYVQRSAPIEEFAGAIGQAVQNHVFPHVKCRIFAEPGRWLCHDTMHILVTVVDKKADDLVVTDAGTNALGWERLETDYFPVINLTRPQTVERPCLVLGSLCTPHDLWGYAYFGEAIEPGDVLLVPTLGAYTYSLRQQFIKPLPKPIILDGKRPVSDWDTDD